MNITALTPEEKILFLDTLIAKTAPYLSNHFYSLYILLGDDLFLIFSIFAGFEVPFADKDRGIRAAQIALHNLTKQKVQSETRLGRPKTITIPRVLNFLDLTALRRPRFFHRPTSQWFQPEELQKNETYFLPETRSHIVCLSGVRKILDREYIIYAEEIVETDLLDCPDLDEPEREDMDFISAREEEDDEQ